MSRSLRHTPRFGMTTAQSERSDKQQWHRRYRAAEKVRLKGNRSAPFIDHLSTDPRSVSNSNAMAKDGRQWWPPDQQRVAAAQSAIRRGHSERERAAIAQRLLHKWNAK